MHDLGPLFVVSQVLLVDRLDSDELPRKLVHSEVDFTEGSPYEHLARPVEVSGGFWGLTSFVEGRLDTFRDIKHLQNSRGDGTPSASCLEATVLVVAVLSNVLRDLLAR